MGLSDKIVYFDRGVHDVVAYLNHINAPIPSWEEQLKNFNYDLVFLIKPERSIYHQDEDRMETFDEALKVHENLKELYHKSGLKIINLPFTSPEKRLNLVLKQVGNG